MKTGMFADWKVPNSPDNANKKGPEFRSSNAPSSSSASTMSPATARRHSYSGPSTPSTYPLPPPKLEECLFSWPLASVVVPPTNTVNNGQSAARAMAAQQMHHPNYTAYYQQPQYCLCCVPQQPYMFPPVHTYFYHPSVPMMHNPLPQQALDLQVTLVLLLTLVTIGFE